MWNRKGTNRSRSWRPGRVKVNALRVRTLAKRKKKAGGERGLGDEIRRRLQASFDDRRLGDATTYELLEAIERRQPGTDLGQQGRQIFPA